MPIIDQNKRTGRGTKDSPLTAIQIKDLSNQGIREGDTVPNRGVLKPGGYFEPVDINNQIDKLSKIESTTADKATSSDTPIVKTEKSDSETISLAETASPSREAIDLIDVEIDRLNADLQSDIAAIRGEYEQSKAGTQADQTSETGELSVKLAGAGGYLGFSGSGTGVMLNLAKAHRAELAALQAKRDSAINEAKKAQRDRRFDLMSLKAKEISDIDQEVYDRQQDYFNNQLKLRDEKRADQAAAQDAIDQILSVFGGVTKDEMSEDERMRLESLAEQANIPVDSLYAQIAETPLTREMKAELSKDIRSLVLDAAGGGAPKEILDRIASSTSLSEAASIAQAYTVSKGSSAPSRRSGDLQYTDGDVAFMEEQLRVSSDTDISGYYSNPETYSKLLSQWVLSQGREKDFVEEMPIERWVDPNLRGTGQLPDNVETAYKHYFEDNDEILVPDFGG